MSAPPTPAEILADPDRILELYECCPECGSHHLEALTFKATHPDFVGIGCWECDWMIHPERWTPPTVEEEPWEDEDDTEGEGWKL